MAKSTKDPTTTASTAAVATAPAAATSKRKKAKKSQKKLKKAPGAPRRFKTAFIFFSTHKHKEIRQQLGPEKGKEKTTTIAKMVSEAWKNLSKEERAVWDDIAAKDKARYELEKQMYKGPWQVPNDGRDPLAPRRPCSAFIAFLNCKREEVKKANPGVSSNDLMRIAAKLWRESPERSEFLAQEAKDLEKYKSDMKEWHEKQKRQPEAVMASKREEMAWMALEANQKMKVDEDDEEGGRKSSLVSNKKRGVGRRQPKSTLLGGGGSDEDERMGSSSRNSDLRATNSSVARDPRPDLHASVSNVDAIGLRNAAAALRERQCIRDGSFQAEAAEPQDPLRAALSLDLQATQRIRQAFALQREALVRQLAQPALPPSLVGGGSLMADPVIAADPLNVELALLLQRRRDECDLLVMSLLERRQALMGSDYPGLQGRPLL